MASPRPWPAVAPCPAPVCLLNRCGSRSGETPLPLVGDRDGDMHVSQPAAIRIGVDSGAYRAAFAERLSSTCTTRRWSAITGGRPAGRSTRTPCRAPLRKVLRVRSTRRARPRAVAVTLVSGLAGTGQQGQLLQVARGRADSGLGTRRGQKASVPQPAGRLAATAAAAADCSRNRPRSPDRQCGSAGQASGRPASGRPSSSNKARHLRASSLQRPSQ